MSTLDFFAYLADSDATHELALELAEAWTDHQLKGVESAA